MNQNEIKEAVDKLHKIKMMYGSTDAPFWFVGLEEANGGTEDDAISLLGGAAAMQDDFLAKGIRPLRGITCNENACPDNCQYQQSKFLPCLHSGNEYDAVTQTTWLGYIKLLLTITQGDFSLNAAKKYQKYHLCDIQNTAQSEQSSMLELYPLHCVRGDPWPYGQLSKIQGLEHLHSNRKYWDAVRQDEWQKIVILIEKHQPQYVFLLGADNDGLIGNASESKVECEYISFGNGRTAAAAFGSIGCTTLVNGRHPAAFGITNDYWRNLANAAKNHRSGIDQAA